MSNYFIVQMGYGEDVLANYNEALIQLQKKREEALPILAEEYKKIPPERQRIRWRVVEAIGAIKTESALPTLANIAIEPVPTLEEAAHKGRSLVNSIIATTSYFWNTTTFWTPHYFYDSDPLERATTLVHEAQHHEGYHHNAPDNSCARKASCDSSWGYNGANKIQALYAYTFFSSALNTTPAMRKSARALNERLVEESFDTRPNWWNQVYWCVEPQHQWPTSTYVNCY